MVTFILIHIASPTDEKNGYDTNVSDTNNTSVDNIQPAPVPPTSVAAPTSKDESEAYGNVSKQVLSIRKQKSVSVSVLKILGTNYSSLTRSYASFSKAIVTLQNALNTSDLASVNKLQQKVNNLKVEFNRSLKVLNKTIAKAKTAIKHSKS